MPQCIKRTNSFININKLLEFFFILGFTLLTYQSNIYIAFGILPLFFIWRQRIYVSIAYMIIILLLMQFLYYIFDGTNAVLRVIKTTVVLLPIYYTNFLEKTNYHLSDIFRWFMKINALLVIIDFILYFTIGHTIMELTVSGFMPRPCGLLEDSNFFSYLMLITIFYYRWRDGQYSKLFILSLFLSCSFSAIIVFLGLLFVFKFVNKTSRCTFQIRVFIVLTAISIISIYDWIAIHPNQILTFISQLDLNDLIKVKMISMTHRFNTVSNAMQEIDTFFEVLMGIGAGKTRELSNGGFNLHNSFLQMFLEMGVVLSSIVIFALVYMVWHIRQTKYVILFCAMLILSSIMETFYNPLLSFVYYISFLNRNEKAI